MTGCTTPTPQQGSLLLLLCPAVVCKTIHAVFRINQIAVAHGTMENGQLLTDSLLKQRGFIWLCCKQTHQLPLCCISDKVAGQGVFVVVLNCTCWYHHINQDWNLKYSNLKVMDKSPRNRSNSQQFFPKWQKLLWVCDTVCVKDRGGNLCCCLYNWGCAHLCFFF